MSAPSTSTPPLVCWSCQDWPKGPHFCASCGKIQQLPRGIDHFLFFGFARRLHLDEKEIERRFHELSWKLHPDNFVKATESERALSLEQSSQLNDAYRTLREPVARIEYLLALEGMRKEGEQKQQAPPELLEEVFELNESLDELREAKSLGADLGELRGRLEAAEKGFQEKLAEVDAQLDRAAGEWDSALDANAAESTRRALLAKMNELLNRRSYIRNLVRNVAHELAH
ncbi:MAG TPA: Fe-S protein assembly co-chaperone HscB [Methylomirabilota bacterium]|nr:Fe-S protein assembly co-chaperone HscB [Methylomirabilota bacterium]